jgi:dTMP kinase
LVLFLDLEEDKARERGGWGGEVYEQAEIQRRVKELFWELSLGTVGRNNGGLTEAEPTVKVGLDVPRFRQEEEDLVVVDAGSSVEEVAEDIWLKVKPRVEAVERGEVGKLVRRVS